MKRRPDDPRVFLEQVVSAFPDDREKVKRVFVAAVLEDRRYVTGIITAAFDDWTSRPPQSSQ